MEHGLQLAWHTVLKMADGFFASLPNLCIAAGLFWMIVFFSNVSGRVVDKVAQKAHMDVTLAHALGKLTIVAINIFGLLVCAVIVVPSFSLDKLIAGLGITSVAIGFAFQNILQNFFAGMLLLWQKPFRIGDEIKAGDFEGTVEDITIRATILRTFQGQRVIIPNGNLFTSAVTVNTAFANRQIHVQVPVEQQLKASEAVDLANKALIDLPSISNDPPPKVYASTNGGKLSLDIYAWAPSKSSEIIKATNEATFVVERILRKESEKRAA